MLHFCVSAHTVFFFFGCVMVCVLGIEINLRDSQGRTALEILKEHPAQKSQQITALIQGNTQTHTLLKFK